jgi:phospholipase/carboxylesterase
MNKKIIRKGRDIYIEPLIKHDNTLIWLHGLGDSANGFLEIFK